MQETFRAVPEKDRAPAAVCAPDRAAVCMGPSAKERCAKRGGEALPGEKLHVLAR